MFEKFKALLGRFRADESGVTAIEYGLIALAIVVGVAAVIFFLGDAIQQGFQQLQQAIEAG